MKELADKVEKAGFRISNITYFMALLFPLLYMKRIITAHSLNDDSCLQDIKDDCLAQLNPNPLVNNLLYTIFSIEPLLLQHMNLPIGGSLLCVAQKKEKAK